MLSLYIAATIFALGILIADFIFSSGEDSSQPDSVLTESKGRVQSAIFRLFKYFRYALYFCVGFGPTGMAAVLMEKSSFESLLWALGAGIVVPIIAKLLTRISKKELDSSVKDKDLFMEHGIVLIPIEPGQMGKVKIKLGDVHIERYAKGLSSTQAFQKGDTIVVSDVQEGCVLVELES